MRTASFTQLLESNRDRVFRQALYCLRDPDDAQDVTQDVFVKLWHKGDGIEPGKAPGWLMAVTHNLCIDLIRRRRTQRDNLGYPDPEALLRLPAAGSAGDPLERLHLDRR